MNDRDRFPSPDEAATEALRRWASRGTRRGSDAVLAAAQARAAELQHLGANVHSHDSDGFSIEPTPHPAAEVPATAGRMTARRGETTMSDSLEPIAPDRPLDEPVAIDMSGRPLRVPRRNRAIAGVGLAALLGVGGYAAFASQTDGGARSPEAAVEQLAKAISDEDALAAVDVLAPAEVASMRASLEQAATKAEQFDIVEDAARPLTGIDFDVDGLTTEVETLADGYAKVTITGGVVDVAIEPTGLAPRVQNRGVEPTREQVDLAESGGPGDLGLFVVAVERDGGWYVSPAYTGMEYAREVWNQDHTPVPAPAFGTADPASLGAGTPESAVRDALEAWRASDWVRLAELAPPAELPVWEYRDLVVAASRDLEPNFTVERFDVQAVVDGSRATATIAGNGSLGDGGTWQVGGECPVTFPHASDSASDSPGAGAPIPAAPSFCLAGNAGGSLVTNLFLFGSGPSEGPITVELVEHGGRWFVSPTRTALDALNQFVASVDERFVAAILEDYAGIEPDGTIQLGVPVEVSTRGVFDFEIYEFDGRAGQEVIGEFEFAQSDERDLFCCSGDARIVRPDGEVFGDVSWYPFALPVDGRYRVVVRPGTALVTFTLWDAKDAPPGVVNDFSDEVTCDANGCSETVESSAFPVSDCVEGPAGTVCRYYDDEGNVVEVVETPIGDPVSVTTAKASGTETTASSSLAP